MALAWHCAVQYGIVGTPILYCYGMYTVLLDREHRIETAWSGVLFVSAGVPGRLRSADPIGALQRAEFNGCLKISLAQEALTVCTTCVV
jgi:hypothetical protein